MILETYTGLAFDYDDPQPEMVSLTDIARALSLTARFGGHTSRFYSVAAHSLLVRALVIEAGHPELASPALLHDAHETYLTDIPTPLKAAIGPKYRVLTRTVDEAIGTALGVDHTLFRHHVIKQADAEALMIEAQRLKRSKGMGPGYERARSVAPAPKLPPFYRWQAYRTPAVAEQAFLRAHASTLANAAAA